MQNYRVKRLCRCETVATAEKAARAVTVFLCIFILLPFILCGCGDKYENAREVYEIFSQAYGDLPRGALYFSEAEEWEDGYLSDETVYSLYGDAEGNTEFDNVESAAIYLSNTLDTFYEFAIFICYDNYSASEVAKMCHKRIDEVRRLHTFVDISAVKNARVEIHGRVVIMSILPSEENTARAFRAVGR